MKTTPQDKGRDSPPRDFPEVNPKISDMGVYTTQMLFEMQHSLGRIESKLDNIDRTVSDVDGRLRSMESKASWIKGALACAVILIPICFGIVWWSLGERIENALRFEGSKQAGQTTPGN